MGQAGHALEVAVKDLFDYNGFEAETNVDTTSGEHDVVAESGEYHAFIECKEFSPSSTSRVTRDMISNIAKKAEMVGSPNAVLVTTKPPSQNLLEFARQAGVVVRSWDEVQEIQEKVGNHPDGEKKRQILIDEFNLVKGTDNLKRRKRKEFLSMLAAGKASRETIVNAVADFLGEHHAPIVGTVLGAIVLVALAVRYIPAVRQALYTAVLFVIALGIAVWMFQDELPWDLS